MCFSPYDNRTLSSGEGCTFDFPLGEDMTNAQLPLLPTLFYAILGPKMDDLS
jgi:hypothetical protein